MIRDGAHVVLTQMMSTHDVNVRDSLDFPNLIKLNDIKQNFRYDLEIYGMVGRRTLFSRFSLESQDLEVFRQNRFEMKNLECNCLFVCSQ